MFYLTLLVILRIYFDKKIFYKATQVIQGLEYRCENTTVIGLIQNGKRCISLLQTPGIPGKDTKHIDVTRFLHSSKATKHYAYRYYFHLVNAKKK